MPETRRCNYCGKVKPAEQFKKISTGKGSAIRIKYKCTACLAVSSMSQADRDAHSAVETAARRAKAHFLQKMRSN